MSNSVRACAFILLLAAAAMAQQETPAQLPDVVALPAGAGFVGFRLETTRAGASDESVSLDDIQAALVALAVAGEGHTIHRVLVDRDGRLVFGYDLSVEPLAPARRFKVSAQPLSAEFKERLRAHGLGAHAGVQTPAATTSLSTLPRATAVQTLDDGDAFALDLLVNPQTGVRLTDVVK